jgi:hypothetical protein
MIGFSSVGRGSHYLSGMGTLAKRREKFKISIRMPIGMVKLKF